MSAGYGSYAAGRKCSNYGWGRASLLRVLAIQLSQRRGGRV
jgi:hypothetical protein